MGVFLCPLKTVVFCLRGSMFYNSFPPLGLSLSPTGRQKEADCLFTMMFRAKEGAKKTQAWNDETLANPHYDIKK